MTSKDDTAWDKLAAMAGPNPCWFHPFIAWLWTGCIGAYVELGGHYPWQWIVAAGAATSPLVFVLARKRIQGIEDAFEAPRAQAGIAAVAGWLAMTGWAAWSATHAVLVPPQWAPLGVVTFVAAVLGGYYAHMRCTLFEAHELVETKQAVADAAVATPAAPEPGTTTVVSSPLAVEIISIFRDAGFGSCTVVNLIDRKLGPEITIRLDPDRHDRFATVKDRKGKIIGLATRRLRALGIEISDDTIEFRKAGPADMVQLQFRLHEVFENDVAIPEDTGPTTINLPIWLGKWDDAEDIMLDLRYRHGKLIGGTDSGKSTLENMVIYGITRTVDCIPWMGGLSKLLDLAGPWLQPLADGRATQPVLDYVEGQDWDAVSRLLRVAYCTIRIRETAPRAQFQRDKNRLLPGPDQPLIHIILEESDVIMRDPRLITLPDGTKKSAADLILYIVSKGRQYAVQLELLNQGVTQQQMGRLAGAIKINVTRTAVFWTPKKAHGNWALPDGCGLDTTTLPPHCFYLVNGRKAQPRQGKAGYIDEEVGIPEAAIRHQQWMTTLEDYTQKKLREMVGDEYAGRWSYDRTQVWRDYFGEFPHLPTPARESVSTAGSPRVSPSPQSPARKGTPVVRDGKPGWEYPGGFFVPDLSKSGTVVPDAVPAEPDEIDSELGDIPEDWRGAFDEIQGLDAQEPVRPARPVADVPEPLGTLLVRLADDKRDFVPIDELAQLAGMDAGELGSRLTDLGVPSERRGTNRTRGRSLAKMRIVAVCHATGQPLPTAEPDDE